MECIVALHTALGLQKNDNYDYAADADRVEAMMEGDGTAYALYELLAAPILFQYPSTRTPAADPGRPPVLADRLAEVLSTGAYDVPDRLPGLVLLLFHAKKRVRDWATVKYVT